jgi:hypothetical protein
VISNIYTTFNEHGLLTVCQVLLTLNGLNMLQVNNPNDRPVTVNKYHLHITLIKQLLKKPRTPEHKLLTPSALAQQLLVFTVHRSNCGALRLIIVPTCEARCRTHTDTSPQHVNMEKLRIRDGYTDDTKIYQSSTTYIFI